MNLRHSIDSRTKKNLRVSKEDKRNIYYISKALEALHPDEKNNLLKALNIDPASLLPKNEVEFRNECSTAEAATTMHRYHHQRLLLNYQKIKDFMNETRKRHGMGSCIYLSKEGSRLMANKSSD